MEGRRGGDDGGGSLVLTSGKGAGLVVLTSDGEDGSLVLAGGPAGTGFAFVLNGRSASP
ncbi:MAG TPA: hypothetical protein VM142_00575 [Acidimicrobiales bacterium]|nr:hypothetical protein [Acidimicrobiales bacterium]